MSTFYEVARSAITRYTEPDDLIIDPACGTGDALIAAVHTGRLAIGVEQDPYLISTVRHRIDCATESSNAGYAAVAQGDPLVAAEIVGADVRGRAALIITSLRGIENCSWSGPQKVGDLADDPSAELGALIACCRPLLKPDGRVVVPMSFHNHQINEALRARYPIDNCVDSFLTVHMASPH